MKSRLRPPEVPGILQVAALSGFSPATVSRALRGLPGVSPGTRRQVQDAATQLQYRPSPSAAALASGRTALVGLIPPPDARWFGSAVLDGMEQVLHPQGFDLMLYPSVGQGCRHSDQDTPNYRRVDGLLVLTTSPGDMLSPESATVPMVSVGGAAADAPAVTTDNIEVGRLATQHLIDLGHRSIAFVGTGSPGLVTTADRFRGYQAAMRNAGILAGEMLTPNTGGSDHVLRQLLTQEHSERATAVVTASEEEAIVMLLAARGLGVRIPADLSIVGTGGGDLGLLFDLTTAGAPPVEQGRAAATLLLELIAGGPPPDRPVTVQPLLLQRGTTSDLRACRS